LKKIGGIFQSWRKKEGSKPDRWTLDKTPTFAEEVRDFTDEEAATGAKYDLEQAKIRIDSIARHLAIVWSAFLAYIIVAQGASNGAQVVLVPFTDRGLNVIPFDLAPSEFIAVVTTTTASVFGFLVIVANHLFKAR
jgi:hypothetical protein